LGLESVIKSPVRKFFFQDVDYCEKCWLDIVDKLVALKELFLLCFEHNFFYPKKFTFATKNRQNQPNE
jgi:hypothetical protein